MRVGGAAAEGSAAVVPFLGPALATGVGAGMGAGVGLGSGAGFGFEGVTIIEPVCAVFRRHLRGAGLKYTSERARVLAAVLELTGPFLVEGVLARLRSQRPVVSKATAYRTIKLLEESGIVRQVLLTPDQAHYQVAVGGHWGGGRGAWGGAGGGAASGAWDGGVLVRADTGELDALSVPGVSALIGAALAKRGLRLEVQRLVVYARAEG